MNGHMALDLSVQITRMCASWFNKHIHTYIHTYMHTYIHTSHICVCASVCVSTCPHPSHTQPQRKTLPESAGTVEQAGVPERGWQTESSKARDRCRWVPSERRSLGRDLSHRLSSELGNGRCMSKAEQTAEEPVLPDDNLSCTTSGSRTLASRKD